MLVSMNLTLEEVVMFGPDYSDDDICPGCAGCVPPEPVEPDCLIKRTAVIQSRGYGLTARNFQSDRSLTDMAIMVVLRTQGFCPFIDDIVIIDTPETELL